MSDSHPPGGGEPVDPLVGTVLAGRYQIVEQLGAGGMGTVYKAKQLAMDRFVALKLLHLHYTTNKQAVARFDREMQVTARIEHPNTIRVYDYGQAEDGRLFLAMEYLEGRTLKDALGSREPMGSERLAHIAVQIGKALSAAHSDGVVHRDLKPDNVMLLDRYGEKDFVKVLDFGIARFTDDTKTQLTAEGAVVGTPAYMSPEQATGGGLDERTDIYSFGVMLFEMATGQVPFDAPTTISLMVKHVQEAPPRPSELAPGLVSDALETLILQMLAKNPAARPQTIGDVVRGLEAALGPAPYQLAADTHVPGGLDQTFDASALPARPGAREGPRALAGAAPAPEPRPKKGAGPLLAILALLLLGGGAAALVATGALSGAGEAPKPPDATTLAEVDAPASEADAAAAAAEGADTEQVAAAPDALEAAADGGQLASADGEGPGDEDGAALAAVRARLEAAEEALGDPVAPEGCRLAGEAAVTAVTTALEGLKDGRPGGAREADLAALAGLRAADGLAGAGAEYWVALARAQLFSGEPAASVLETAQEAVASCDAWAAAHNALGNAHLRLGDAAAATEAYRRAVELDRDYVAPRFNLGVLALKAADQEGAVQAFSAVLARAPDTPLAHMLRGQAYLKLDKRDDALADFLAEVERDSSNERAWLLIGQVRSAKKDAPGALVAFCKAKELGASEAIPLCPDGAPE